MSDQAIGAVSSLASVRPRAVEHILATLAEHVSARLNASTVFGSPVERDGVTIIPVAAVRFTFGGGCGGDSKRGGEGEGGGAIGRGTATGYIELKDGRSRFVPIVDPARMLALAGAGVLVGILIGRRTAPRRARRLLR
jgi:uncharacterized spore protein YtfJ